VFQAIEDAGYELGAIYHSHTRSAPIPSQTDVNLAKWWPEPLWVIVGLDNDEPDVRAWRIVDGTVSEAALEVEDGAPVDA
jgi:[CysO sulfur-carrier protein]-S-L-cysteine hydrolase